MVVAAAASLSICLCCVTGGNLKAQVTVSQLTYLPLEDWGWCRQEPRGIAQETEQGKALGVLWGPMKAYGMRRMNT